MKKKKKKAAQTDNETHLESFWWKELLIKKNEYKIK